MPPGFDPAGPGGRRRPSRGDGRGSRGAGPVIRDRRCGMCNKCRRSCHTASTGVNTNIVLSARRTCESRRNDGAGGLIRVHCAGDGPAPRGPPGVRLPGQRRGTPAPAGGSFWYLTGDPGPARPPLEGRVHGRRRDHRRRVHRAVDGDPPARGGPVAARRRPRGRPGRGGRQRPQRRLLRGVAHARAPQRAPALPRRDRAARGGGRREPAGARRVRAQRGHRRGARGDGDVRRRGRAVAGRRAPCVRRTRGRARHRARRSSTGTRSRRRSTRRGSRPGSAAGPSGA